jgi:hypothetical protein
VISPQYGASRVQPPRAREFFPLALGNQWTYDRRFEITIVDFDGSTDPLDDGTTEVFEATAKHTLTGIEEHFGRDYTVEARVIHVTGSPDTTRSWFRFRQDHAGLYQAMVSTREPPAGVSMGDNPGSIRTGAGRRPIDVGIPSWERVARLMAKTPTAALRDGWRRHVERILLARASLRPDAGSTVGPAMDPTLAGRPGGPYPEELIRLLYPLHRGTEFFLRTEPFAVVAVVEATEVLDLPAGRFNGYRIRINNEQLDPEDVVLVWRSRCGELGSFIHVETLAMDVETGEVVRIITKETSWLSGLSLKEPGRCHTGTD